MLSVEWAFEFIQAPSKQILKGLLKGSPFLYGQAGSLSICHFTFLDVLSIPRADK